MRAFRWITISGLIALAALVWASAGGATRVTRAGGAPSAVLPSGLVAGAPFGATTSTHSSFFSGYQATQTGSTSTSVAFHVPKLTCGSSTVGLAPSTFLFAQPSGTYNGAGVLVQCANSVLTIQAFMFVEGVQRSFSNPIHAGDAIVATVSVGGGVTSIELDDNTPARHFVLTDNTGTDSSADFELLGTDVTSAGGSGVPTPIPASTKYSGASVGGAALGTLSPSRLLLTSGCEVLLQPGGFDTTKMIFTVASPHIDITALKPPAGVTGKSVEIDGFGFNSGTTVKFGSQAAAFVSHDSANVLHATVPTKAITDPVSLNNTTTPVGGITSACSFAVLPKISSFVDTATGNQSGITGSTVTIHGSGFGSSPHVSFGTKRAHVSAESTTQISAVVPNGAVTDPITVSTPSGSATTATNFTPTLSITSLRPSSGPFGTLVTLLGVGFNSTSKVFFNGHQATVTPVSGTEVKASVPSSATTGLVAVTNAGAPVGTVRSATNYTVTPHTPPTVTSFDPASGAVGASVTITGTFFSGASAVKFGTAKASYTINSATKITAKVPSTLALSTPVKISVTTAAGTGTSMATFKRTS